MADNYVRIEYQPITHAQYLQLENLRKGIAMAGTTIIRSAFDPSTLKVTIDMAGFNPLPDIQSLKSSISGTLILAPLGGSEITLSVSSALIRTQGDRALT